MDGRGKSESGSAGGKDKRGCRKAVAGERPPARPREEGTDQSNIHMRQDGTSG